MKRKLKRKRQPLAEPVATPRDLGFAAGSLALAGLAVLLLPGKPLLGLALFIAAAVTAAFSLPGARRDTDLLTWRPRPLQGWEPWAVLALVLFSATLRYWRLDILPSGATFPEALAAGKAEEVMNSYTPHANDFHVGWPTMIFYQARAYLKFMDWGMVPHRLPSAGWGTLGVLVFYFAARRLFSAPTAILVALLYSVSNMNLFYSRNFYPIIPLYFAVLGAIYFLVAGLQTRKPLALALAGGCVGLALHGYFPGRLVLPLFACWFAWLFITRSERSARLIDLGWFTAGFVIIGLPVIYYALRYPDRYWSHVAEMNPNSGRGLGAYFNTFAETFPPYLRMFHLQPDGMDPVDDGLPMIPLLKPDLLTQALFPLGVGLCLAGLWRPLPALLLAGIFAFIVPAVMGTRFPHPTTRRAALVLPFVYLFAAYAVEQLRAVFTPALKRLGAVALWLSVGLVFLATAGVCQRSIHSYYVEVMDSSNMRWAFNNGSRLAGNEVRALPNARPVLGAHLVEYPESNMLLPRGLNFINGRNPEDDLCFEQGKDMLLLVDPYQRGFLQYLERHLQGVTMTVVSEPGPIVFNTRQDPMYQEDYYDKMLIPAVQAANFSGMLDDKGMRVDITDPGFGARNAGKLIHLQGVLIFDRVQEPRDMHAALSLAWPGFQLKLDGKPTAWGKDKVYPIQSFGVEIMGRVPRAAAGSLPLLVSRANTTLPNSRMLAMPHSMGFKASVRLGVNKYDGPAAFEGVDPFVFRRVNDPYPTPLPYSLRMDSKLHLPGAGLYAFRLRHPWNTPSILINGKVVYTSKDHDSEPVITPLLLNGVATIRIQSPVWMTDHPVERTFIPEVKGPGDTDFKPLPIEWLNWE